MSEHASTLWTAALTRLNAVDDYLSDGILRTGGDARRAIAQASQALEAAAAQVGVIKADPHLSAEGKRALTEKVIANANSEVEAAQARVAKVIQTAQEHHQRRAEWPRSEGTDADREARLGNARADLARLLENVPAGQRGERLAFAARNGSEAMRELLFTERYAERVLWPSVDDGSVDAVDWAHKRVAVAKELHPGGESAARSIEAVAALEATSNQVPLILKHAASMELSALSQGLPAPAQTVQ